MDLDEGLLHYDATGHPAAGHAQMISIPAVRQPELGAKFVGELIYASPGLGNAERMFTDYFQQLAITGFQDR